MELENAELKASIILMESKPRRWPTKFIFVPPDLNALPFQKFHNCIRVFGARIGKLENEFLFHSDLLFICSRSYRLNKMPKTFYIDIQFTSKGVWAALTPLLWMHYEYTRTKRIRVYRAHYMFYEKYAFMKNAHRKHLRSTMCEYE